MNIAADGVRLSSSGLVSRSCVSLISPKYSWGLTRTKAPVGQFSSQEYAGRDAPAGFSGVASQRLHLIATMSSPSAANGAGAVELKLNSLVNRLTKSTGALGGASRGNIEMAL